MMKSLIAAAEKGNVEAMLELADAYEDGLELAPDTLKAAYWYRMAYESQPENPRALNNMGRCAEYGYGGPADPVAAMQYYRKAAVLGYSCGQYNYAYGLRQRGDELCLYWYEKAYENGSSQAAIEMGEIFLSGELGQKDEGKGIRYLWRAIDMENPDALVTMGRFYLFSDGENADYDRGIQLLSRAAEKGSAQAAEILAAAAADGSPV